jgi:hypothetical protein
MKSGLLNRKEKINVRKINPKKNNVNLGEVFKFATRIIKSKSPHQEKAQIPIPK